MNFLLPYVSYYLYTNEQIEVTLIEVLSNESKRLSTEELKNLLNEFTKRSIDITKIKIKNQNLFVYCIENQFYSSAKVLIPFFDYKHLEIYQTNYNNQNIFHLLLSPFRITTKNQCDLITFILKHCFVYDVNQKSEILQQLLDQKSVQGQFTSMNCFLQRPHIFILPKETVQILLNNSDLSNQNNHKFTMLSQYFLFQENNEVLERFMTIAPQMKLYNLIILTQNVHLRKFENLFMYHKYVFKNLFWNLDKNEYNLYLQWLPHELIDDIFDFIYV